MFINNQLGGMNFAFPDVCNTPTPVGPIPIPYPNITMPMTAVPAAYTILVFGGPAHNMSSEPPVSMGDNTGLLGGLVSAMDMGPTRHMLGAFTCLLDGMPATRLGDMTGQNGELPNSVGASLVPCQVSVLCLAG
ncbi:MAG: DUF4150 domain-containing protein [Deltaproteobacteria bacterium]|nr:DUF4150 domain-containing protein [Deltaproteobacteria bacterium]